MGDFDYFFTVHVSFGGAAEHLSGSGAVCCVRSRIQHPLSTSAIARAAGVSARTLFSSFQRQHGCAPMQYVRPDRLEQVRSDLLAGGEEATVTDLALGWGFAHLGRVAGRCRAPFGETPSDTLGRVRRQPAGRVA